MLKLTNSQFVINAIMPFFCINKNLQSYSVLRKLIS